MTDIGKIKGLKWIIISTLILLPILFLVLGQGTGKSNILAFFLLFVWLLFVLPQLILLIQYINITDFERVKIDYDLKKILITRDGQEIIKDFSEIKRINYYNPNAPIYYGSVWLTLCTNFYYYRIEFDDGLCYLTSLLTPNVFLDQQAFYDTFVEIEVLYANIKK